MNNRPELAITVSMSTKEVKDRVAAAKQHFGKARMSTIKTFVVNQCLDYAETKLAKGGWTTSVIGREGNRYQIYSNLLGAVESLDDLHFAHYAMRQLSRIRHNENSSFRESTLPTLMMCRRALVAPMVTQMQKGFAGLAMMGMAALLTDHAGKASTMMLMGTFGYICSTQIVDARLDRSLEMKFNRVLTNGVQQHYQLEDGMSDEIGRFLNAGTRMLGTGLTLFEGAGRQFDRAVGAIAGRMNPQLEAPQEEPQEDQQRANALR